MEYSIKHIYPLWSSWQLSAAAYEIVGLCVWSVCVCLECVCVFGVCERNQDDGECSERINSRGFPVQLRRTFMEIIFRNGFLLKRGQIFLCVFFLSAFCCRLLVSPETQETCAHLPATHRLASRCPPFLLFFHPSPSLLHLLALLSPSGSLSGERCKSLMRRPLQKVLAVTWRDSLDGPKSECTLIVKAWRVILTPALKSQYLQVFTYVCLCTSVHHPGYHNLAYENIY